MPDLLNVPPDGDGLDPINHAEDPAVVERIQKEILSKLPRIRGEQSTLHDEWSKCFAVWDQKHEVRLYEGASDLFIPVARNIVETFVAQVKAKLFPYKFIVEETSTGPMGAMQQMGILPPELPTPDAVGGLLRHFIEQASVGRRIEALIRDGFIYGTGIVKFPWLTKTREVFRRRPLLPPELAQLAPPELAQQVTIQKEQLRTFHGPAFQVVDPFRFYVSPVTVRDLDDAQLVFEDVDASYYHLQAMEKAGIYTGVARLKDRAKVDPQVDGDRNRRLTRYGLTVESTNGRQAYGDNYVITEIWACFDLEGTGEEYPCKIVACGDVVLEARRNPFVDQRAPYRAWKLIDFPDLFFGQGLLTGLKHQQYAVNALVNQGIDSAVYQTNPVLIANAMGLPQGMGSLKIGYRGVMYVNGRPDDNIKPLLIPDTSKTAFETASLIMSSMRDMAGAPPILQGKLGSNEQTATEASILGENAQSGVDNFVSSLEESILTPMLHDWYVMSQQFLDEPLYVDITGEPKPVQLTAEDLVLDYRFRWLSGGAMAAQTAANAQETAYEQSEMMKDAAGAPMVPGAPGETPAEMGGQPMDK